MRFCDKLPKLRKNNNYSQEQLADKLNVSRQAVSKWELGSSYPDMDKMLQMCRVLNCTLEELMDDGVIGGETVSPKTNKNVQTYIKDFLDFITRSYNMFCSMKLREKTKCIFEMACIAMILLVIGLILYAIMDAVIMRIIGYSTLSRYISNTLGTIVSIVFGIVGVIIWLHLFKIRYLDYFITIEDQNVIEKTIEEPMEKKEDKYYQEKPKEKVIIRDAKHSTFSFFEVLGKMISVIVKACVLMCIIPIVVLFAFLIACLMISFYHVAYGAIFFWIAVLFIGMILIAYVSIEWAYHFIIAKKQHFKRMFITFIIGLILIGISMGLSICIYLNYNRVQDFEKEDYLTEVINLPVGDRTIFDYKAYGHEYKIDNTVSDLQLEITYLNISEFSLATWNINGYEEYYVHRDYDSFSVYKLMLDDFKNKKARNYDYSNYIKVTASMSQDTFDRLQKNQEECERIRYNYYMDY